MCVYVRTPRGAPGAINLGVPFRRHSSRSTAGNRSQVAMPRAADTVLQPGFTPERTTCSRLRVAGIVLVLVSSLIIVAVLVSCQAEGGWYCTTYGHPHPEIFKKIYELHGGEYGDLIFGSAQAVLITTLMAFPSMRRLLQRRYYCLWHRRGGAWHWFLLLFLPLLVFCGGLLNRIRGCAQQFQRFSA